MTLGVHTMIILQKFRKSMSRQTYQMHKTALFSLIMQIVIPGVLLVAPLSFCMFVIIMEEVGLQGEPTKKPAAYRQAYRLPQSLPKDLTPT